MQGAIDELDLTVKHIRSAIFGLEASAEGTHDGVRTRVLDLVSEAGPILEFEPTVLFEGPVDTATPEPVATDMLATLREALSNVAHHARADRVDVVVAVAGGELVLRVTDDGVGPPDPDQPRDHGLANIATRGTGRTGSLDIRAANPDGTVIDWRVPIK